MASKLPVWGIDVGQCSLKAVKLQLAGDDVAILAVDVVEHDRILAQAESEAPEMIKKAVKTFLSRNNIRDSHVVVSVPGQQTLTRFTKMPPVEPKKIPDMVKYEASQQIPFDMDEVVWDYQVFTEEDSPDVEVGIFAIRKELIRNHLAHFTDQGIEPIAVQTSPMSSYNAARFEWSPEDGTATILLDMGALATDLIIFEGDRVWSRPVPVGGNRFTEALVSAFKISFKKAEGLKRSAATSKYARQVFQAMRPVFADLVSEVQRSIGFYTSTHRETNITRVLGMGNAFKLPGLQKFLKQNLQIDVQKITGFKRISEAGAEKSAEYAENVMSFGVAHGLALQGLGLAAVEANLLPVEVRRTLLWRKKQAWFGASAACLAIAAGSLWVGNVMASSQLSREMGGLDRVGPKPVRDVDEAERIIRSGASEASVEWLATVAGAAGKLKEEQGKVSNMSIGDQGALKRMAKLPSRNVLVPQIVDVVHRAFMAAATDDLKAVKTAEDYVKYARQMPREQRHELWIQKLQMIYHATDPEGLFDGGGDKKGGPQKSKPGWAVQITGETTEPNPAKYLDEKLISVLDTLGREPDRGIYFSRVTLAKVTPKSVSGADDDDSFGGDDIDRRRRGPRGGGRGRGGRGSDGPRFAGPPGAPPSKPGGAGDGDSSVLDRLLKLQEELKKQDPLTREETSGDQRFVIQIVVMKGDTPAKLIPKEYKGEKGEKGEDEKREEAEPRRDD
ncbi:MAG: type IV pilus assembly protein PilM [Phycisphaerae bacterium]|nr:type IV pilus assembly protein PilM [Phycisphaerae bacterium]